MIRALIIARDRSHQGGVVSFVELLVANFSQHVQASRFTIGRKPDKVSRLGAITTTIYDCFRLISLVKKHPPDVIHINPSLNFSAMLRDGLLLTALAITKAPPLVVFIHGWDEAFLIRLRKYKVTRHLFSALLDHAACVIVLANRFKGELCSFGIDAEKIHVTTTMFDPRLFENVGRVRHDAGLRLIFLSRLVKEKGLFELLEAFLILSSELPDLTLIIAGDGPEYERANRWIKNHRLNHKIEMAGYLRGEEKAAALSNADIFVFPSYYGDGCPVSLLEAMAAGLGVVTTPVGGIPDFFADGKNGSVLDIVSPTSIANAIRKLSQNTDQLNVIRQNNKSMAWASYNAPTITGYIEKIYECAIDTQGKVTSYS